MLDEIEAMEDLRVLGVEMSGIVEAEAGDGCGGCGSSSIVNSCSSIDLSGHVSLFSFLFFWLFGGRLCVGIGIGRGSSSSLIVVAVIHSWGGEGKGELRATINNNNYILIEIVIFF